MGVRNAISKVDAGRLCWFGVVLVVLTGWSCRKLVAISEPVDSITTSEVFSTDAEANSAMAGIYTRMINNGGYTFSTGVITIYTGMSSDELYFFYGSSGEAQYQFETNTLNSNNSFLSNYWNPAYSYIYEANAIIEGINHSTSGLLHDSVRKELVGEAKFVRAFCYFYLTNLFGDLPLVVTTNWNATAAMVKTSQDTIYQQIIGDLVDAQNLLSSDFSVGGGERIRPNSWAATALLARVYLYTKQYSQAIAESSKVIGEQTLFKLESDVGNVFNYNSGEAIWQLKQNNVGPLRNGTVEGFAFIPFDSTTNPDFPLRDELVSAFEPNDNRFSKWVGSTTYEGQRYYYPYKYNVSLDGASVGGDISQYYMVLRLAEQYLIRAEAKAFNSGGFSASIEDLNVIRSRAGLLSISPSSQADLVSAILQERRVELFAEWGHRWFDLKRSGNAHAVLSGITEKQPWTDNSLLYPLPYSELTANPHLVQNPGYN